jgi:hypothetical protein
MPLAVRWSRNDKLIFEAPYSSLFLILLFRPFVELVDLSPKKTITIELSSTLLYSVWNLTSSTFQLYSLMCIYFPISSPMSAQLTTLDRHEVFSNCLVTGLNKFQGCSPTTLPSREDILIGTEPKESSLSSKFFSRSFPAMLISGILDSSGTPGVPSAIMTDSWSSVGGSALWLSDSSTPVTKVSSRVHAFSTPSLRVPALRPSLFKGDKELSGVFCALLCRSMVGKR